MSGLGDERGRALLAVAAELLAKDPARAALALRKHTDDAALASAALSQASLRASAAGKFGADAASMFFTRDGLEQSSRAVVANRRAARLAGAGAGVVADLCCGIGGDAFALARRGLRVLAVDRDESTVAIARANAEALGLTDLVEVRQGDALETDLSTVDAVFADPARRINRQRIFDPSRYSPPLNRLWDVSQDVTHRVCKVGPGIDHAVVPSDAEAEWVSVDGSVVEAALWRGPVARAPRRATVITAKTVTELSGSGNRQAPVGEVGEYLYEPDGAVIRAHLVAELADQLGARVAHPSIAYLYGDFPRDTWLASVYRVLEVLPFHVKRLRQLVAQRGIGRLTIKKRGADIVPDKLRTELKPSGDNEATLVVTRVGERHMALLCEPLR